MFVFKIEVVKLKRSLEMLINSSSKKFQTSSERKLRNLIIDHEYF